MKSWKAIAESLAYALKAFTDYYAQAGIGDCERGHDDDEDDQFDGDEKFNVRQGWAALEEFEQKAKQS